MALISPVLPTIGQPNSTEDQDVINALTTIISAINGGLDTTNLAAAAGITGAQLAAAAGIGVAQIAAVPACIATGGTQSTTSGTITPMALTSESLDQGASSQHDNSVNNSRLTCQVAGLYLVTGEVYFAANGTGYRQAYVQHGGGGAYGEVKYAPVSASDSVGMSVTALIPLVVGGYVELMVRQTSGGALDAQNPSLSWVRVST